MRLKPLRAAVLTGALLMAAGWAVAQAPQPTHSPFTVLSNNADVNNKLLYVEIMYEKPACSDYKAQFRLATRLNPVGNPIAVDSFLNNPGTYETELSGTDKHRSLMRPTAGGYRLRFKLDDDAHVDSGYQICVDAYTVAYRCVGCATGGSDAIFASADIDPNCPYIGGDLLACYQRESAAANWEAWIQDPRDCKPYRIIQLRDGKWWFAQNLNYTNDLQYGQGLGEYLCPSGKSLITNTNVTNGDTTAAGSSATCTTYGALYSWQTAMAYNGRSSMVDISTPTAVGVTSNTQGICPDGWLVPADYDWGSLLNSAEDGCIGNFTDFSSTAPCNHNRNDATLGNFGTTSALASLKTLYSCRPHSWNVDSICARSDYPAWTWRRADYQGKIASPYALGTDKYGFNMLPSGYYNGSRYTQLGKTAMFWTSSEVNVGGANAYSRTLTSDNLAGRTSTPKGYAAALRCMVAVPVITIANAAYTFENSLALAITRLANPTTYTYTWSATPSGKITFPVNNTTAARQVNAPINFTAADVGSTYTLSVVSNSTVSGKQLTTQRSVTVAAYTPTITAIDTVGMCWGDSVTLSVPQTTLNPYGYSYTWSVTPDDGHINFAADNGTISAYRIKAYTAGLANPTQSYTFTCTVQSIATSATISRTRGVRLSLLTAGVIGNTAAAACGAMTAGYIGNN